MKYRKKPIVIEAFQYDGDLINKEGNFYVPEWASEAYKGGVMYFKSIDELYCPCTLFIKTLEGDMVADVGDYIIKGIKGELYPCKPDIFEKTYDEVVE